MSTLNINKFKGLRQDVDYPELPVNYCHQMENLDIDDELGKLKVRDGYAKLYNNVTFTTLLSAYEYRFDKSGNTIIILNDNGTLKTITDGGAPASLTLPTGATLEASFKNQFFGWRDHVLITTGNSATNYMLWYGYLDRENDDGKGLFGNVEEFTGYEIVKAQLTCPNGVFSNVRSTIYIGGYYYFSFENSKYIEKRDTDFHLIERFAANTDQSTHDASVNADVSLAEDGTYAYVAYSNGSGQLIVEKINPIGWAQQAEYVGTIPGAVAGVCTDGTNVYLAGYSTTDGEIHEILVSTMVATGLKVQTSDEDDILDICCDDTADVGVIYIVKAAQIERRSKVTLAYNAGDKYSGNTEQVHCAYVVASDDLYVSSTAGDGHVYDYDGTDFTGGEDNDYTKIDEPKAFVDVGGTALACISSAYGTLQAIATSSTLSPGLVGLNLDSQESGDQLTGTYYYKIAVVDVDGQEYTLSDSIRAIHTADSRKSNLKIIAHTANLEDLYRVQYINLYRAYNTTADAESEATDYKFLKQIDINSAKWVSEKTDHQIYYYIHIDNETEETISSTTFLESSGLLDTVKPRYVNGKYLTWLDNKLHVANFYHDGDSYPNRVIRSPNDQPDNIAFYDYYDFDVGDGDVIKGITESFGRSLVFKSRKFATFYDGSVERRFIPGLSSEEGFTKKDEDVFFVSDQGLYHFDGNKCTNIYDSVKTYFNNVNSYSNATVFYIEKTDRIIFSFSGGVTFALSLKHGVWQYYPSGYGFKKYFKDYTNRYIGFTNTAFYIVFNSIYTKDSENFGGGSGNGIGYLYESPLLRFSNNEGDTVILIDARIRSLLETDDVCQLKLYDYKTDTGGKTLVETHELLEPPGSAAASKTIWFDKRVGESFSYTVSGTTPADNSVSAKFEFHGITFEYLSGGIWYG